MGTFGDGVLLQQAKKAQGETNDRLDALIAEQRRTNELLTQLLAVLAPSAAAPGTASWEQAAPR